MAVFVGTGERLWRRFSTLCSAGSDPAAGEVRPTRSGAGGTRRTGKSARPAGRVHNGFKLFLDEDPDLLTPAETMAVVPRPELVSYQ